MTFLCEVLLLISNDGFSILLFVKTQLMYAMVMLWHTQKEGNLCQGSLDGGQYTEYSALKLVIRWQYDWIMRTVMNRKMRKAALRWLPKHTTTSFTKVEYLYFSLLIGLPTFLLSFTLKIVGQIGS